MDAKLFKPIPGFSNYRISSTGAIYSVKRRKLVASTLNHGGYVVSTITDDSGYRAPRRINRLVYTAFIGPIYGDNVIDHIDDNKLNNYYMNLQQITQSENSRKSFISGANKEKVVWSKDEVNTICKLLEANRSCEDIYSTLNIGEGKKRNQCRLLIDQLLRGEIHRDIAINYRLNSYIHAINKKDRKFDINEAMDIYMRLKLGERPASIAKEYGVTFQTICKIRDKKTWVAATNFVDLYFEDL